MFEYWRDLYQRTRERVGEDFVVWAAYLFMFFAFIGMFVGQPILMVYIFTTFFGYTAAIPYDIPMTGLIVGVIMGITEFLLYMDYDDFKRERRRQEK